MKSPRFCEALIVGGGPAGAALAIALAKEGRDVVLIEKSKQAHHKVCGEFLSPESLPLLRRAGVHPETMGAQTIHSVRLVARDVLAEVRLPAVALSLTRRTLDEALLEQATQSGANVLRGNQVESLSRRGAMWRAQAAGADCIELTRIEGSAAFLATGKHDLRGWPRTAKNVQGSLVAMKMYFELSPEQRAELAGHVEVLLFPGGYAGLQPVEGGRANLCALIQREKLRSLGGKWERMLGHMQSHSAHLARRLSGAVACLDRPLALSAIPYGYCVQTPSEGACLWRLGDQAAVIPSFCGDGMAIALYTADRAAQLYLDEKSAADFQAEVERKLQRKVELSTLLSRTVIAIPSIAQAARLWPAVLSGIFASTRVPGIALEAQ